MHPESPDGPAGLAVSELLGGVVVYDRHATIANWLRCWDASYRGAVPLAVCHTRPEDLMGAAAIRAARPDHYFPLREEGGQDIAALGHAIRHAPGDWGALFWCTDDVLPMIPGFLDRFAALMTPGVGLVGLHLVAPWSSGGPLGPTSEHVRTACFLLRREAAERLTFPPAADGKAGCYRFEHADPLCMTAQVRALGYGVTSLHGDSPVDHYWSPGLDGVMWDTGHVAWDGGWYAQELWRRFEEGWGL